MQILQVETGREWLKNNFKFMKENLEDYVKVFWQIDPFGASSLTPLLFSSETPFKYRFCLLNRIGDEIKDQLKLN
jgi:hypothetical protein